MVVENKKDMWCHILSFLQFEFVCLPIDQMASVFKCSREPRKKSGHNEIQLAFISISGCAR
jgi:hypothetical protein